MKPRYLGPPLSETYAPFPWEFRLTGVYSKARLPARCSGNEPALLPRREGGEGQDWTRRERRERWKSSLLMTTVTFWFLHFWKYCLGTNGTPGNVVLPSRSEFVYYFLMLLLAIFFFCMRITCSVVNESAKQNFPEDSAWPATKDTKRTERNA